MTDLDDPASGTVAKGERYSSGLFEEWLKPFSDPWYLHCFVVPKGAVRDFA